LDHRARLLVALENGQGIEDLVSVDSGAIDVHMNLVRDRRNANHRPVQPWKHKLIHSAACSQQATHAPSLFLHLIKRYLFGHAEHSIADEVEYVV
jgi:hypothetical protein